MEVEIKAEEPASSNRGLVITKLRRCWDARAGIARGDSVVSGWGIADTVISDAGVGGREVWEPNLFRFYALQGVLVSAAWTGCGMCE